MNHLGTAVFFVFYFLFVCLFEVFDPFGVCDLGDEAYFVFQMAAQLPQYQLWKQFISTRLRCCLFPIVNCYLDYIFL